MSDFTIELVRAFNISTYCSNLPDTNFKVENGSSMTMDFGPSLTREQCTNYLVHLKEEIIGRFYNYADGAKRSFNFEAFPFNFAAVKILPNQESGGFRIKVDITPPVLFNLRCQLVHSMARPIKVEVEGNIVPKPFDRKKYLMRSQFEYKESADKFSNEFVAQLSKLDYSKPGSVVVRGKEVYITTDVFNDIDSVKGYIEYYSWLIGRTLEDPIEKGSGVETLKGTLAQFIYNATNIKVGYYDRSSYEWSKQQTIFVPIVKNDSQQGFRYLKLNEVKAINCAFGFEVLNNVEECISDKLPVASPEKTKGIYGIDFYNKDISNCVINTLFENSVINKVSKDYRLEINPNLKLLELYQKISEMGLLQESRPRSLSDREGGESSHPEMEKETATLPRKGSGKKKKQPVAGTSNPPFQAGQQSGAIFQFGEFKLTRQQPSTSAGASSWSATIKPLTTQFRSFDMGGNEQPPFRNILTPRKKGDLLPQVNTSTDSNLPGTSDKAQETGDKQRKLQSGGGCNPDQTEPERKFSSSSSGPDSLQSSLREDEARKLYSKLLATKAAQQNTTPSNQPQSGTERTYGDNTRTQPSNSEREKRWSFSEQDQDTTSRRFDKDFMSMRKPKEFNSLQSYPSEISRDSGNETGESRTSISVKSYVNNVVLNGNQSQPVSKVYLRVNNSSPGTSSGYETGESRSTSPVRGGTRSIERTSSPCLSDIREQSITRSSTPTSEIESSESQDSNKKTSTGGFFHRLNKRMLALFGGGHEKSECSSSLQSVDLSYVGNHVSSTKEDFSNYATSNRTQVSQLEERRAKEKEKSSCSIM